MECLRVRNLHKSFGSTEVLKNIDFELRKGNVLSIIGSSGSGKTTLLRCLNFLELADGGSIEIDDRVIYDGGRDQKAGDAALRRARLHFGLVFQSFNLFPQYTALKNVVMALNIHSAREIKLAYPSGSGSYISVMHARKAAAKKYQESNIEKAKMLLRNVGLGDKMDNYPGQLSGGQQQRVAIARALALDPDVLCFDEPTSALDPELTGEVLRVIRELKSPERTMIIVTHEMEFARKVSDYVIFMDKGVVAEEGPAEEVFGNPRSERLRSFLASTNSSGN